MSKLDDAATILKDLELPPAQQNERSCLVLLAFANVAPESEWSKATAQQRRLVDLMAFIRKEYDKDYAPNSREDLWRMKRRTGRGKPQYEYHAHPRLFPSKGSLAEIINQDSESASGPPHLPNTFDGVMRTLTPASPQAVTVAGRTHLVQWSLWNDDGKLKVVPNLRPIRNGKPHPDDCCHRSLG